VPELSIIRGYELSPYFELEQLAKKSLVGSFVVERDSTSTLTTRN